MAVIQDPPLGDYTMFAPPTPPVPIQPFAFTFRASIGTSPSHRPGYDGALGCDVTKDRREANEEKSLLLVLSKTAQ